MTSIRQTAEVFPPGEFIKDELESRGLTQKDLAAILGKPLPSINKIIKGRKAVTAETATKLAAAFETSAGFWMNLEAAWQLSLVQDDNQGVRDRAALYESAPVREMVRRGWLDNPASPEHLNELLLAFYKTDDLSKGPSWKAAARAAVAGTASVFTPAQVAWVCRCIEASYQVDAQKYRESDLTTCVTQLATMTESPEELYKVPLMLAEAGVRLVAVEQLKGSQLDGGALRRGVREPVVAVTLRHGRLDYFWHTLFHELAHILYKDGVCADAELQTAGDAVEEAESRANRFAASHLVPDEAMESFIRRTTPIYSHTKILNFARRIGVHPSIVAGQLKYRREVDWGWFHKFNVQVREQVRASCVSDGWKDPLPNA